MVNGDRTAMAVQKTRQTENAFDAERAAVMLRENRVDVEHAEEVIVLRRTDTPSPHLASLRALIAEILVASPTVRATAVEDTVRLYLPDAAHRWLTDPGILWEFLAGRIAIGDDRLGGGMTRVEVETVTGRMIADDARAGTLRVCRAESRGGGGALRVGWLVRERGGDTKDRGDQPGRDLARSLHRLRTGFRALGFSDCRVGITRHDRSEVDSDRRLYRIVTDEWEAFWPVATVERLRRTLEEIGGVYVSAEMQILAAMLADTGLAGVIFHVPRSPEARRAVYAIRTIAAIVEHGGRAVRSLVDSAYRSGERFRTFQIVYRWSGARWAAAFDAALGADRAANVAGRRRIVDATNGEDSAATRRRTPEVWRIYAAAVERFVAEYATAARRRGMALDADSMTIVQRFYLTPRSDALRRLWDRHRNDEAISQGLEAGLLSKLRRIGRSVPRRVLVEAVAGRDATTRQRVSAIFSRTGRRLFLEDVDALEAAIDRGEFVEWERLLAAQQRLRKIAEAIR